MFATPPGSYKKKYIHLYIFFRDTDIRYHHHEVPLPFCN